MMTRGAGAPVEQITAGDGLMVLTAYEGDGPGVVASVEEFDWKRATPWWQAALSSARVGDRRRVWFCSAEAKREWGDLSQQGCVVVDVELTTHSESQARSNDDA
jgi:hypothetical protein